MLFESIDTVGLDSSRNAGLTDNATAQVAVGGASPVDGRVPRGGTSGSDGWHTSTSVGVPTDVLLEVLPVAAIVALRWHRRRVRDVQGDH